MTDPLALPGLARAAWGDYRRARSPIVVFAVAFTLLQAWLLAPGVYAVLAAVLRRTGRVAVSNWDILDFLLTPAGLLYAAVLGTVAAASLLVEQAGIMAVAGSSPGGNRTVRGTLRAALRKGMRIAKLGAIKVVLLALTFLPFVLLALLTRAALLSGHDLYFYLRVRPPAFWVAAGVGGLILLAAAAAGTVLYVRWAFALPILLFEDRSPAAALRASRDRVRGAARRVAVVLIGWQLAAVVVGAGLLAGFRAVAAAVLDGAGERPVTRILVLLVAHGGLLAGWAFATVVGQSLLTRRLYLARSGQLGLLPPDDVRPDDGAVPSPWPRRLAYLFFLVGVLGPLALWAELERQAEARPPVRVTAHRGHARAAPENTLSAIRKAIESGADYAEIDVQMTADGVVVLLHDRDLMRVAGDSRRLTDLTLDQVRRLDVGSWFGPTFAGERVPTLAEVIDVARGRIGLNIELKLFGPDRGLAAAVARLVREKGVEGETVVTSFDPEVLREVRRHAPGVRTGLIVAHAIGDVSRVDVDVLNVRADHLTADLLRDAHARGREVHVWTVNDPADMTRFMKRGVDNILTSDPDLLIRVRGEWLDLTAAERLVLGSRLLLGLDP